MLVTEEERCCPGLVLNNYIHYTENSSAKAALVNSLAKLIGKPQTTIGGKFNQF